MASKYGYEVMFLDARDNTKSGNWFENFRDAQARRDDLIAQGYEAWIEDTEPSHDL